MDISYSYLLTLKHVKLGLTLALVSVLAACGGGGGGSDNNGNDDGGGGNTTYSVGGTISGIDGADLVLQNNNGDNLSITDSGTFMFSQSLDDGESFAVSVFSSPNQSCNVTNGSGKVSGSDITNISLTCETNTPTYTISGTVSGLEGTGLVLENYNNDDVAVSSNGGFSFSQAIMDGGAFSISVTNTPSAPNQSCNISNGSGTVSGANVTNITLICETNTYTVSGTVTGLVGSGLILQNNGEDDLAIASNGSFTFSQAITDGNAFAVSVASTPNSPMQSCSITNGSGNVSGLNITNVVLDCETNRYTIGGTISGLEGSGLILQNNDGNDLSITADGNFTFSQAIVDGGSFSVAVVSAPSSPMQSCSISNESGNVSGSNVSSITLTCDTNTYTIGGTVSGLLGIGLVLQNNGGDSISISADGPFTFATSLTDLSTYSVTVANQPSAPLQFCAATNNNAALAGADVSNIDITCADIVALTNAPVWQPVNDTTDTFEFIHYAAFQAHRIWPVDIDQDGDLDILTADTNHNNSKRHELFINNDGNFSAPRIFYIPGAPGGISWTMVDVAFADIDGDTDLDIISLSRLYRVEEDIFIWFANDGSGNFSAAETIDAGSLLTSSISLAYIDDDEHIDILTASKSEGVVGWYSNDGLGNFSSKQTIAVRLPEETVDRFVPFSAIATDLNNDNYIDAIISSGPENTVAWYQNNGSGAFGAAQIISNSIENASMSVVGDIDNDNDIDVFTTGQGAATLAWFENMGSENFNRRTIGADASEMIVHDIDNDGDLDVVARGYGTSIGAYLYWYEYVGNQDFIQHIIANNNGNTLDIAPGDVNSDGNQELIWLSGNANSLYGRVIGAYSPYHSSYSVEGNQTLIITGETATDPDGDSITYQLLDGPDILAFSIDSASGQITFTAPPEYAPLDHNGDNLYKIWVSASDGVFTVNRSIWVSVDPA